MNVLGRMLRVTLFGESHGDAVGVVVDGCPAGLPVEDSIFDIDMRRRRGEGRWTTPRGEPDIVRVRSGVTLVIANERARSASYEKLLHTPRPGHADRTAQVKYGGYNDHRGGGEFSGRMTAPLVAAGVLAKSLIASGGIGIDIGIGISISIAARVAEIGGIAVESFSSTEIEGVTDDSAIQSVLEEARKARDSLGGVVVCRVEGVPAGVGEPFFDGVEAALAHALFSIPGAKGVSFGAGFRAARMRGSVYNDAILDAEGTTETNHSGGINGGVSNGNPLVVRVAFRPPSSIARPQRTVDLRTGEPTTVSVEGDHDVCFALRTPVIVEALTAVTLADLLLQAQRIPRVIGSEKPQQ